MRENSTFDLSQKEVCGLYLESLIETLNSTSFSAKDISMINSTCKSKKLKQPDVWKKKYKMGVPSWQRSRMV